MNQLFISINIFGTSQDADQNHDNQITEGNHKNSIDGPNWIHKRKINLGELCVCHRIDPLLSPKENPVFRPQARLCQSF